MAIAPPVTFFYAIIRRTSVPSENIAQPYSRTPLPANVRTAKKTTQVVTQTAQHDFTADHEAHDPAVNLPNAAFSRIAIQPGR
jgi:hypothetical protein